ncbi:MAG: formate/nitrite transporter family protein [Duncaniella sp.]|nr:formate/nitrite transporter family protein [Duncaniella sp.]
MELRKPAEITAAAAEAGAAKARLTRRNRCKVMVAAILAGAYISFGATLSLTVGFGFGGIASANPGLQKLMCGLMFPIGLLLVVVLGAELFTGNNAVLVPSMWRGEHGTGAMLANWAMVYAGNFIGAMAFTYFLVYAVGLTASDPWHSAIRGIAEAKVSMSWMTVFLKGIGANWCVCLAVWLALSGKTLLEKALGCWLPVMAFVALGYEHCIANMFYLPLGMMEGADVSVGRAVWCNLIPATLGNIVGGALLVGAVHSYLHLDRRAGD